MLDVRVQPGDRPGVVGARLDRPAEQDPGRVDVVGLVEDQRMGGQVEPGDAGGERGDEQEGQAGSRVADDRREPRADRADRVESGAAPRPAQIEILSPGSTSRTGAAVAARTASTAAGPSKPIWM